jgi:septal ring factor EnvC (AmiA/AmiB activator)
MTNDKKNIMQQRISYLSILFFLTLTITAFAQKSEQLKDKRNSVKAEIDKTSSEIKTTVKNRKTTYEQFLDLKKTASSKQQMVKLLEKEIDDMEIRLERQEDVVNSLAADLGLIKERYAELLRKAYRQQQSNQQFLFLISAFNFNDFIQRWRFLQQYHSFKKRQVDLIRKTQVAFETQNKRLAELQLEKTEVIEHVKDEAKKLGLAIQKKERTVKQLTEKEKALKVKLTKHEKARAELNSDIEKAIYAELKTERAENRTVRGLKPRQKTAKETEMVTSFLAKKGALPMPVNGKIVGKFGLRIHTEANNTKTESPGIDIETSSNASVAVVHDGVVIRSFFQPDFQHIVLVKHGDYFTLYSNLKSVVVKKGTILKTGDIIGKVGTQGGKTELHFQIWQNDIKLNPEEWIKK